jgi:hypothetical protein
VQVAFDLSFDEDLRCVDVRNEPTFWLHGQAAFAAGLAAALSFLPRFSVNLYVLSVNFRL